MVKSYMLLYILIVYGVIVGMFPVKNPFRKISEMKHSFINLLSGLSILIFCYSTFVQIDVVGIRLESSRSREMGHSEKIIFYMGLASYLSGFIPRLLSFAYSDETLGLCQNLISISLELHEKNRVFRSVWKKKDWDKSPKTVSWPFIGYLFLTMIIIPTISIIAGKLELDNSKLLLSLTSIPPIKYLGEVTLILMEILSSVLPLSFALLFILIPGSILIQLHGEMSKTLLLMSNAWDEEYCGNSEQPLFIVCARLPPEVTMDEIHKGVLNFEEFPRLFLQLKEGFQIYSKISGLYLHVLVVTALVDIINALTNYVFFRKFVVDVSWFFFSCQNILLLASFGEYVNYQIEASRQKVEAAYRNLNRDTEKSMLQMRKYFKWFASWRWRLTANNCFDVNRSMIPKVMATVLGSFILLFELQRTGKLSTHAKSNKTMEAETNFTKYK